MGLCVWLYLGRNSYRECRVSTPYADQWLALIRRTWPSYTHSPEEHKALDERLAFDFRRTTDAEKRPDRRGESLEDKYGR